MEVTSKTRRMALFQAYAVAIESMRFITQYDTTNAERRNRRWASFTDKITKAYFIAENGIKPPVTMLADDFNPMLSYRLRGRHAATGHVNLADYDARVIPAFLTGFELHISLWRSGGWLTSPLRDEINEALRRVLEMEINLDDYLDPE